MEEANSKLYTYIFIQPIIHLFQELDFSHGRHILLNMRFDTTLKVSCKVNFLILAKSIKCERKGYPESLENGDIMEPYIVNYGVADQVGAYNRTTFEA